MSDDLARQVLGDLFAGSRLSLYLGTAWDTFLWIATLTNISCAQKHEKISLGNAMGNVGDTSLGMFTAVS